MALNPNGCQFQWVPIPVAANQRLLIVMNESHITDLGRLVVAKDSLSSWLTENRRKTLSVSARLSLPAI
jgi:hypothetical protein